LTKMGEREGSSNGETRGRKGKSQKNGCSGGDESLHVQKRLLLLASDGAKTGNGRQPKSILEHSWVGSPFWTIEKGIGKGERRPNRHKDKLENEPRDFGPRLKV